MSHPSFPLLPSGVDPPLRLLTFFLADRANLEGRRLQDGRRVSGRSLGAHIEAGRHDIPPAYQTNVTGRRNVNQYV